METIKEFLVSDIYLDIIKELGVDNFNGSIINVGVTPLRCHFQHYFFAKK